MRTVTKMRFSFFGYKCGSFSKTLGGARYGQQRMDGDACWLASSKTLSLLCCPLLLVHDAPVHTSVAARVLAGNTPS